MKNNFFVQETTLSGILIVLVILSLNPFNLFMPPPLITMINFFLIAAFGIFVAILWKEKPRDEREGLHSMIAGRFAFLVGSGILIAGIMLQSLRHTVDFWLVYTLVGMIFAKIIGHLYGQQKH